ncbi:hypothetical protein CYLTODRAFT_451099 [Cylindrobasidium torrendii FP15055 ss-10]|uniref:Glyoxylate reductase n=1 Tax=Cylindrobasidium torrendii FP15055 ss-10 TaxID=1314674 RepID=A0A0D7BKY0_9AGAR|nr:hypothetical protein CYLTODRAFT_451099 [Cylindrobasidium torrendii FP15055 ss-10]
MAKPKVLMINGFETTSVPQDVQDKLNGLVDFTVIEQAPHDTFAPIIAETVASQGPFVACIIFLKWFEPKTWPWPLDEALIGPLVRSGCRFFSSGGAGFDFADISYLTKNGAYYANTAYSASIRTSDSACMMILQVLRNTTRREDDVRNGRWQDKTFMAKDGRKSTLGLIGMGTIGRLVAQTMSTAFGMKIIYHNRSRLTPEQEKECGGLKGPAEYVSFDEILQRSDVLSLHCPLTEETRHLINRESIAKMRDGIILVNTSRGPVVHEEALVEGLESGKILRAALDVFEFEPEVHPKLIEMRHQTILQPHCAVANETILEDQQCEILSNLEAFIKTGKPNTPVNTPALN